VGSDSIAGNLPSSAAHSSGDGFRCEVEIRKNWFDFGAFLGGEGFKDPTRFANGAVRAGFGVHIIQETHALHQGFRL
jgi:hypothetical protein